MTDVYSSASRYWNTVRYLKPIQIANRVWRAIYRPNPSVTSAFTLRAQAQGWIEPARTNSTMRGPSEFEFLSVRRDIRDARDWNDESLPMLWRYHLHYFDDLNAIDFRARFDWHQALLRRWIAENPPVEGVGWDPYPSSLRIVNWIKWWLIGAPVSSDALQSVRLQLARVMSRLEYHLLGNHLLENGRALVFGGLFFQGNEATKWLNRGSEILARQLPEQILGDGGHFERSPMYHQITLAGLLDLYNLMRVFEWRQRCDLVGPIQRMLRWSALMRHPDGEIALFNDSAFHEAPSPQSLEKYASRLGIEAPAPAPPAAAPSGVHLRSSGYVRVARSEYTAILNVGSIAPDYQPGHAHADTLSFELSVMGRRLLVDTGTSTYEPGPRRSWERGTAAHNSVVVNGRNSSDVWGGFRVARRARILGATLKTGEVTTTVTASHDGYRRLPVRAVHQRHWEFCPGQMRIDDSIDGRGEVDLELILNVHPDFKLTRTSINRFAALSFDEVVGATIETPHELTARIEDFSFAPRFGTVQAATRIVASARIRLPQSLTTIVRFSGENVQRECT